VQVTRSDGSLTADVAQVSSFAAGALTTDNHGPVDRTICNLTQFRAIGERVIELFS
jgi:hypothetical protein